MAAFDSTTHSHRRFNPLTNEYILVSPHRMKRPWLGQTEPPSTVTLPQYEEKCLLCPGNTRINGEKNPDYAQNFTFENDFAAILPAPAPETPVSPHPLMTVEPVHGTCDVLIFHRRHDITLAQMLIKDIEVVIAEWIRIYLQRGSQVGIKYVQIFENKGAMMGCSNPHPHGQVWSMSAIPTIPAQELRSLKTYALSSTTSSGAPQHADGSCRRPLFCLSITHPPTKGKPCMLCEYAYAELNISSTEKRVVLSNEHWVAVVPWWATWPFEILVIPYRRHIEAISDLSDEEKITFADILSAVTRRYDNLFSCSFAYSMGIHQRPVPRQGPVVDDDNDFAHLHLHFDPPLLRSSSVRKFLVGFELMAEAQRDLTPEQAAERLRQCSDVHYLTIADNQSS